MASSIQILSAVARRKSRCRCVTHALPSCFRLCLHVALTCHKLHLSQNDAFFSIRFLSLHFVMQTDKKLSCVHRTMISKCENIIPISLLKLSNFHCYACDKLEIILSAYEMIFVPWKLVCERMRKFSNFNSIAAVKKRPICWAKIFLRLLRSLRNVTRTNRVGGKE